MKLPLLFYLLLLRLKSVLRFLKELGIVRIALLILLGAGFVQQLLTLQGSFTGSVVLLFLPLTVVYSFQSLRKDEKFLRSLETNYRLFYFTEYFIISAFFFFVLLFSPYYYMTAVLAVLCGLITYLPTDIKYASYRGKSRLRLPPYAFEWISGFRRYGFFFMIVYLLAVIFSYEIGAVPLALMLMALTIPSFYLTGEPKIMVEVFGVPPRKFLKLKLISALKLYFFITLPLICLFMIFNYGRWYLAAGIYLITGIIIISSVLTKYAFYEENNMVTYLNALITGIIIFSIISAFYLTGPFLFMLPFFMMVYLFRKASRNLKFYLDAYN
jgi:hypothetical protein